MDQLLYVNLFVESTAGEASNRNIKYILLNLFEALP